jgi:multidrug efflux pump subunit AcrA (membrane-fusion protein)
MSEREVVADGLRLVWFGVDGAPAWAQESQDSKDDWLRVAAKARELLAAERPQSDPYPALDALVCHYRRFLCPSCSTVLDRTEVSLDCPNGCFVSLCARLDCRVSGPHPAHDPDFSHAVTDQAKVAEAKGSGTADAVTVERLAKTLAPIVWNFECIPDQYEGWDKAGSRLQEVARKFATAALEFCGREVARLREKLATQLSCNLETIRVKDELVYQRDEQRQRAEKAEAQLRDERVLHDRENKAQAATIAELRAERDHLRKTLDESLDAYVGAARPEARELPRVGEADEAIKMAAERPQDDTYPALRALRHHDSNSGFICPSCSSSLLRIDVSLKCPGGCFITLCARPDCRVSGRHPAHDSDFSHAVTDQAKVADEATVARLARVLCPHIFGIGRQPNTTFGLWSIVGPEAKAKCEEVAQAALEFCGREGADWKREFLALQATAIAAEKERDEQRQRAEKAEHAAELYARCELDALKELDAHTATIAELRARLEAVRPQWEDEKRKEFGAIVDPLCRAEESTLECAIRLLKAARPEARELPRVRREVLDFAEIMEAKLREGVYSRLGQFRNDHKGGWEDDAWGALFVRVIIEVDELHAELSKARIDPVAIGREAADVANMAMMIADNCGALNRRRVAQGPGEAQPKPQGPSPAPGPAPCGKAKHAVLRR